MMCCTNLIFNLEYYVFQIKNKGSAIFLTLPLFLFVLHCCVVAVSAERFIDVCFSKDNQFGTL